MKYWLRFALIGLIVNDSCVDRLATELQQGKQEILVVDGQITDAPGPYTVRLSSIANPDDVLNSVEPTIAKSVSIHDDQGNSEILQGLGDGLYKTSINGIRGMVGRKYHLKIELMDGSLFESIPDEMKQVPDLDTLYYEWEEVATINGPTRYGFRLYVDSRGKLDEDSFVRWRISGVYVVETFPHLRRFSDHNCFKRLINPEPPPPDPPACSGYIYTGSGVGITHIPGILLQQSDCTCCVCWVTDFESKPNLSDEVITATNFKKIEVGFVPFDSWRFGRGKYMIRAEQMSLSKEAFEFWKVLRDQKEGASSLFQPAFGKARSNIFSTNSAREAIGLFYASAIRKKILDLTANDAPLPIPEFDIAPIDNCVLWRPCTKVFGNASTSPPDDWN